MWERANLEGQPEEKIEKKSLNLYVFRDYGDDAVKENRYFEYSINCFLCLAVK